MSKKAKTLAKENTLDLTGDLFNHLRNIGFFDAINETYTKPKTFDEHVRMYLDENGKSQVYYDDATLGKCKIIVVQQDGNFWMRLKQTDRKKPKIRNLEPVTTDLVNSMLHCNSKRDSALFNEQIFHVFPEALDPKILTDDDEITEKMPAVKFSQRTERKDQRTNQNPDSEEIGGFQIWPESQKNKDVPGQRGPKKQEEPEQKDSKKQEEPEQNDSKRKEEPLISPRAKLPNQKLILKPFMKKKYLLGKLTMKMVELSLFGKKDDDDKKINGILTKIAGTTENWKDLKPLQDDILNGTTNIQITDNLITKKSKRGQKQYFDIIDEELKIVNDGIEKFKIVGDLQDQNQELFKSVISENDQLFQKNFQIPPFARLIDTYRTVLNTDSILEFKYNDNEIFTSGTIWKFILEFYEKKSVNQKYMPLYLIFLFGDNALSTYSNSGGRLYGRQNWTKTFEQLSLDKENNEGFEMSDAKSYLTSSIVTSYKNLKIKIWKLRIIIQSFNGQNFDIADFKELSEKFDKAWVSAGKSDITKRSEILENANLIVDKLLTFYGVYNGNGKEQIYEAKISKDGLLKTLDSMKFEKKCCRVETTKLGYIYNGNISSMSPEDAKKLRDNILNYIRDEYTPDTKDGKQHEFKVTDKFNLKVFVCGRYQKQKETRVCIQIEVTDPNQRSVIYADLENEFFKDFELNDSVTQRAADLTNEVKEDLKKLKSNIGVTSSTFIAPGFYYILENNSYTPIQII